MLIQSRPRAAREEAFQESLVPEALRPVLHAAMEHGCVVQTDGRPPYRVTVFLDLFQAHRRLPTEVLFAMELAGLHDIDMDCVNAWSWVRGR